MRQWNRLRVGMVAGVVLSLAAAISVLGYAGQVPTTITVTGPAGNVSCGTTSNVQAFVQDTAGNPDTDQNVIWSFVSGNIVGDKISPTSTTTDSHGNTTTLVTFACPGKASLPALTAAIVLGPLLAASDRIVTIQATAGSASGTISVTVAAGGLPSTSTVPASGTSTVALLAAAFAVLFGSWIILRRISAARS
ncbi:MAG: hypothetical protein ACYDAK_01155 [Candidatus Limnocylindrales bacterium]